MPLQLILHRDALTNVDDPAGRWQYEGGKVFEKARQVGYYAVTRRVVFHATEPQNTAQVTMTVFFLPAKPPQNLTVQGSHDYFSGKEIGSVSAASGPYASHIGKAFVREGDALTIA